MKPRDRAVILDTEIEIAPLCIGKGNDHIDDVMIRQTVHITLELYGEALFSWQRIHAINSFLRILTHMCIKIK